MSSNDLSPPPGARSRTDGSIPVTTSPSALITVLRLIPDALATAVLPPRPSISAAAPATTRRCTSFMWGNTTSKNRARPSSVTSTWLRCYARINQAWTLKMPPRHTPVSMMSPGILSERTCSMQVRALASRFNPHIVSALAGQSLPFSLLSGEYGRLIVTSICALPRAGANRSRNRTHLLLFSIVGMPTIRSLSSNSARVSTLASRSK